MDKIIDSLIKVFEQNPGQFAFFLLAFITIMFVGIKISFGVIVESINQLKKNKPSQYSGSTTSSYLVSLCSIHSVGSND